MPWMERGGEASDVVNGKKFYETCKFRDVIKCLIMIGIGDH